MGHVTTPSPKLSIIVPVYNGEEHILGCFKSAIAQTLSDIELIFVDDGSTDNSAHFIQSLVSIDSRIRYIHQENQGSGIARNNGLNHASGSFVNFLDVDDRYPSNDVLAVLVSRAESSNALIAGGGVELLDGDTVIPGEKRGEEWHFSADGLRRYADYQFDYGYQRFIFSRTLLCENGIRFPDYLRYQDPPFLIRAMLAAEEFYGVSIDTYSYRISHKQIKWSQRNVCDLVRGIGDCFNLAVDYNLEKLQSRTFHRLNREYYNAITAELNAGNTELLELLIFLNCNVFLRAEKPQLHEGRQLLRPLATLIEAAEENNDRGAISKLLNFLR